jgi:PAS domain S-box-containing protein
LQSDHTPYREFFNLAPDLLCIAGSDGYLKKVNPAFTAQLGYSENELLSKPFIRFVYLEDRKETRREMSLILSGNKVTRFENRFYHKDGSVVWLSWNSSLPDEHGTWYASAKVITERKKAEEKFRKTHRDLKMAQRIARLGYWTRDLETEISEWSDEIYAIYQEDPVAFVTSQDNIEKRIHPDDLHLVQMPVEEAFADSDTRSFEHRILTKQGGIKWVYERVALIRSPEGKPLRLEGTIQDISESKIRDEQLRISNERFRIATKATHEVIWDWDLSDNTVTRSQNYLELLGFELNEEEQNGPWYDVIHPKDREQFRKSLSNFLNDSEQSEIKLEYRILDVNNQTLFVADRAYVIRDSSGNPVRMVGAVMDVTESRKLMNKITRQNTQLKQIAWSQSHEVRAPLSKILALVNLMGADNTNGDQIEELLSELKKTAFSLDDIIRSITSKTSLTELNPGK